MPERIVAFPPVAPPEAWALVSALPGVTWKPCSVALARPAMALPDRFPKLKPLGMRPLKPPGRLPGKPAPPGFSPGVWDGSGSSKASCADAAATSSEKAVTTSA